MLLCSLNILCLFDINYIFHFYKLYQIQLISITSKSRKYKNYNNRYIVIITEIKHDLA